MTPPHQAQVDAAQLECKRLSDKLATCSWLEVDHTKVSLLTAIDHLAALASAPPAPAATRYCDTCERDVTGPCSSADCSTPEVDRWNAPPAPAASEPVAMLYKTDDADAWPLGQIKRTDDMSNDHKAQDGSAQHTPADLTDAARDVLAERQRQIAASEPVAGWKLVPDSATHRMLNAANAGRKRGRSSSGEIYSDMIAAAPPAPTEPRVLGAGLDPWPNPGDPVAVDAFRAPDDERAALIELWSRHVSGPVGGTEIMRALVRYLDVVGAL